MFPAARSTAERKPCFSVEKQGLPVQKQSFRALIPGLAAADPAVFDGSGRAAADTGHAVGAAVPPDRPPLLDADVSQRAEPLAFPAGHAGVGDRKGPGPHIKSVKQAVYRPRLQPVQAARVPCREVRTRPDPVRRLPQDVLERAAERIMKETPRVYRVVYDLSAVPPAHVEWE